MKHAFRDDDSKRCIATHVILVFSTADQKDVRACRQKQIDRIRPELTSAGQKAAIASQKIAATAVPRGARKPTHGFEWSFNETLLKDDEQHDGDSAMVAPVELSGQNGHQCEIRFQLAPRLRNPEPIVSVITNAPFATILHVPGPRHFHSATGLCGVFRDRFEKIEITF